MLLFDYYLSTVYQQPQTLQGPGTWLTLAMGTETNTHTPSSGLGQSVFQGHKMSVCRPGNQGYIV